MINRDDGRSITTGLAGALMIALGTAAIKGTYVAGKFLGETIYKIVSSKKQK